MIGITIENLVKKFGTHTALDGVSLRIEPGEIFFLLGPSGCGKTTLLRSIAGFYESDGGRILFDREDVTKVPPHKREVAMMFQNYALWPHLTVERNVAFGLEERKVPTPERKQRVAEALAAVHMEGYAERKIAQLSGGQQQRIALARALVVRPRALLLDEPLSNLDAKLRIEMREEIRRVCKQFGLTAVYVTHDQKEALSISDRMAILLDGRIAQIGPPEQVYRHPTSREVADFIGETNFLAGTFHSQEGSHWRIETEFGSFLGGATVPDWAPVAGEKVTLSIRPESWRIRQESGPTNTVRGRVSSSTYLGEIAQYEFQAASQKLKVFELNSRLSHRQTEQALFLHVQPEDVTILR